MNQDDRERDHHGDIDGEEPVFFEIFRRVVGAVDRRHVVRVVAKNGEQVEREGDLGAVAALESEGECEERQ
jgi:hypothetical protein